MSRPSMRKNERILDLFNCYFFIFWFLFRLYFFLFHSYFFGAILGRLIYSELCPFFVNDKIISSNWSGFVEVICLLTHLMPLVKTKSLLMFSGGTEIGPWHEMGLSIKYVRKIFRKTNTSNPLMRARTCAYQGVRNISFSENFAYVLHG